MYHGGDKLTKDEDEFVWQGKVDNWTRKDLSEYRDYSEGMINMFKDNVKKIKGDVDSRLAYGEIYPEMFLIDVNKTACILTVLNDNLSPESALTEIRSRAMGLFNRSAELLGEYNRTISYDDEWARKLRKNTLKITDAYEQVTLCTTELKNGIDLLSDNISKHECSGDDEHARVCVQRIKKQRDDLISIQPELDTIRDLLAELVLPKDESPVDA